MFKIVQTGKSRDDGTAPFEVILFHEITVREFIQEVLACSDDWGYIRIEKGLPFASTPCCPYNRGRVLTNAYLPFDEADMGKTVVSARADGGLNRMDYWLTVQGREPEMGSLPYL